MKRLLAVLMILVLAVSVFVACDNTNNNGDDTPKVDPNKKSEGSMTYAQYDAAKVDDEVVIEGFVQGHQSWWDNKITVYLQDGDGAYFVYEMACSEADSKKLEKGTKIKVTGNKAEWDGDASVYVEISGKAKVTLNGGSCGIRTGCQLKGTANEPYTKNNTCNVVIKDDAIVDVTAPGQVIYLSYTKENNNGTFHAAYEQSGNAKVTLVNTGKYAGLDVRSANGSTISVLGGTLEITAPELTAFKVQGKPTYKVGEKATLLAGADKDSAKEVAKIATSYKYFKITNAAVNADTSDFVPAAAVVALFATVACAAMIVLRKKAHNA